jgi:4-hydroxy-tetrahydrodipicolinate reductase
LDAPSGTSLATRERMLQARPQQTAPESIPIHSLRLPGVLANQEVTFGGEGELLRVTHETYGPSAYDQGILASLKFATHASGVGHGIEIAFKNRL